jgi:hypothetical protein
VLIKRGVGGRKNRHTLTMKKEKETMNEQTQETALAVPQTNVAVERGGSLNLEAMLSGEFDFNSLSPTEQLNLFREIMEVDAQLELISLPYVSSIDIVGHPITIHDAMHKTIIDNGEEKLCVNFLCENAGERIIAGGVNTPIELDHGQFFTVLKGANAFNDIYVNRFRVRRGLPPSPMVGYEFVEDARYRKANNNAVVLRKIGGKAASASGAVKGKK